jgi:hypothetical protein
MPFDFHSTMDLEELLAFILKRADVKSASHCAKVLLVEATATIMSFNNEQKNRFKHGPARLALLELWRAADRGAPKNILFTGLGQMPTGALSYLEDRASRVLPALGLEPVTKGGLLGWAESASDEHLRTMIIHCAAEGRQIAEGRSRPNGKQSRGRIEPIILGVADRSTFAKSKNAPTNDSTDRNQKSASNAGRGRIDEKVTLVAMLANDWRRATGSLQIGGRSEHNPFNEFVISVFEWAEISNAEHALRAYWSEMKARKARSAPDIGTPPDPD